MSDLLLVSAGAGRQTDHYAARFAPSVTLCGRRSAGRINTLTQVATCRVCRAKAPAETRWVVGTYAAGAAYPEGWLRIEEAPGARLVANLPPYRLADAEAICKAHNNP